MTPACGRDGWCCPTFGDFSSTRRPRRMAHVNDEANCAAIVLTTLTAFWSSAASPAPSSTSAQAAQPRVADCNSNGIADDLDIAAGTSSDCDGNTEPDECATGARPGVDCDDDGWSDACALAVNAADDCNSNGIPDKCELSAGTADDCDLSGTLDECEIGGAKQVAKLVASDGQSFDYFGQVVAIDGDILVVGASGNDSSGVNSGAAYVYERSSGRWELSAQLMPSNASELDYFGRSVAVEGETIVIGARGADGFVPESGAAFVFQRTGGIWSEIAKLSADDGVGGDYFGESLAISGGTVVVGARMDDDVSTNRGSAYVFREMSGAWQQVAKLTASDGAPYDFFGSSVAIDSNIVLVGAPYDDDLGDASGACYLFQEQGGQWHEVAKLTAGDNTPWWDGFGASLAIEGDSIVVGSRDNDFYGISAGAVFVFRRQDDEWVQEALLRSAAARPQSYFGSSLDICQGRIVVGATQGNLARPQSGTVVLFQEGDSGWRQIGAFANRDPVDNDALGYSVAISASTVVSGAILDDGLGSIVWTAYVFEISDGQSDCNGNQVLDSCELLSDPSQDCIGNGYLDICEMHAPDCNANRIPDECETDCNANDIPDDCDLSGGTAQDCNQTAIPDSCEIESGTALDCNGNDSIDECDIMFQANQDCNLNNVPDACEIAAGLKTDCNHNGIPDSCDLVSSVGAHFGEPILVGSNALMDSARDRDVQLAGNAEQGLVAVWRSENTLGGTIGDDYDFLVSRSQDAGRTWTEPVALSAYSETDSTDEFEPRIATDGTGKYVVLWQSSDDLNGSIGNDSDILMVRSIDDGASWSPVALFNADADADDARHDGLPDLAAKPGGVWIAVWASWEYLVPGQVTRFEVLATRSIDGGATWSMPESLWISGNDSTFVEVVPNIVIDRDGNWIVTWWWDSSPW
jgi:hypothetical protein